VDNIKIDLRGIEWDGMGWIDLAKDRISGGLFEYGTVGFRRILGNS
jgi:hypothetical protein